MVVWEGGPVTRGERSVLHRRRPAREQRDRPARGRVIHQRREPTLAALVLLGGHDAADRGLLVPRVPGLKVGPCLLPRAEPLLVREVEHGLVSLLVGVDAGSVLA